MFSKFLPVVTPTGARSQATLSPIGSRPKFSPLTFPPSYQVPIQFKIWHAHGSPPNGPNIRNLEQIWFLRSYKASATNLLPKQRIVSPDSRIRAWPTIFKSNFLFAQGKTTHVARETSRPIRLTFQSLYPLNTTNRFTVNLRSISVSLSHVLSSNLNSHSGAISTDHHSWVIFVLFFFISMQFISLSYLNFLFVCFVLTASHKKIKIGINGNFILFKL